MKSIFVFTLVFASLAKAFTFEDLRSLIETKRLTRIEEVVENLPTEYLENYTLMHQSRSLQEASPTLPRAILYGKDASLVMAFNGNSQQSGYESLEVIQYRKSSHQFEFRNITFQEGDNTKSPVFGQANPSACIRCHTDLPRPNWERYPEWPGAYGSFDDFPQEKELENLQIFLKGNAKEGRYRFLKQMSGSAATPYETRRQGRIRFRPNFKLSSALFAYQAEVLAHRLKNISQGKKWALLFAMSLLKCNQVEVDWKSELKKWYGDPGVEPLNNYNPPDLETGFAYLLRGVGLAPKQFSTEFIAPPTPQDQPYFFHAGIAKDMTEPFANGIISLADHTMSHLLQLWQNEIPKIKNFLVEYRWIENRFKKDPLDIPLARELEEIVKFHNPLLLKNACPSLTQYYLEIN